MLELIVLNPPRMRSKTRKHRRKKAAKRKTKAARGRKKKVTRRGHLGAARSTRGRGIVSVRPARPKPKKKKTKKKASKRKTKKRKTVAKKKTRRKTRKKARRKAPRRKKKTTRRRRKYASPGKSKSRVYRPRIKRGSRVSKTTKKRIARVVGRRYAKKGRSGSVRLNKGRRRRRNQPGGIRGITRQIKNVLTVKTAIGVTQTLLGMAIAPMIATQVAKITKQRWLTTGYMSYLSIAASAVVASAGATALGFRGAAPKILAGGLAVAGSQLLRQILPAQFKRWIPKIGNGASGGGSGVRSFPSGTAGMGSYMSADQLVSGEGRARAHEGLGDWLTLGAGYSPMGQAYTVPRASIAGMGDWMTFKQYPAAPAPIGIPAFSPSTEESF